MNKKKPVIAITPYFNIERDEPYMRPGFIKAIRAAGGIPVILPLDQGEEELTQIADTFDGFVFAGGPDVHAFYFGEETHARCGNVCLRRDQMELALLKLVMERKKPVLGICRGAQILNIGLGGDIYQDIPSQFASDFPLAHSQPFSYAIPSHTVRIQPGTLLSRLANGALEIKVNSMHHQAVRRTAPGLVASGVASDGLTECVEKSDYPYFIGVQWHPEYLWEQDVCANALFTELVQVAGAV